MEWGDDRDVRSNDYNMEKNENVLWRKCRERRRGGWDGRDWGRGNVGCRNDDGEKYGKERK